MENPPKKFFRLSPGKEIRLKHAYYITCTDVIKDEEGTVTSLLCTYDPDSRGGWTEDGRRVRGTSHWVSASYAWETEVIIYDKLFTTVNPGAETGNFLDDFNHDSKQVLTGCMLEPSLKDAPGGMHLQFLRKGYFFTDPVTSEPGNPVFHQIVGLKDAWAKKMQKS